MDADVVAEGVVVRKTWEQCSHKCFPAGTTSVVPVGTPALERSHKYFEL